MRLRELAREIFKEKFPPQKVLFRVDAGNIEGLSFGHLSRCLILAKEIERSANSETIFLMRDYSEGVAYAKSLGCRLKTLSASLPKYKHNRVVVEWISKIKPDCLVVDLPDDNPDPYLDYARKNQILTVCIDDTAKQPYRADVILNSSILAERSKYGNCLPTTRFLMGMNYFIMDDYSIKKRNVDNDGSLSVLITFGGSDPLGFTEKTIRALAEISWHNVDFTVILGPGFKEKKSVIDASKPLQNKITIVECPKDIKEYFLKNDLAICAGGRTLYELFRIGVPCIAIASSENEALVIKKFIEKGLLLSGLISWDKKYFLRQLKNAISSLSKQLF